MICTMTIGLAAIGEGISVEELVKSADETLYLGNETSRRPVKFS